MTASFLSAWSLLTPPEGALLAIGTLIIREALRKVNFLLASLRFGGDLAPRNSDWRYNVPRIPPRREPLRGQALLRFLFRRFWPYQIKGDEYLPQHGPAIVVANHASYLDGLLLYLLLPMEPRFVVWAQHYETPLLGRLYRHLNAIPVDGWRDGVPPIGQDSYRAACRHLQNGGILVVFPEGGRTPDGRFLRWRPGAARLALATGAPLVPVTINGLFEAWPMYCRWPRRHRVEVIVHPPVSPSAWSGMRRRVAALQMIRHVRDIVAAAYRLPQPECDPPPTWVNPYFASEDPLMRAALDDDPPRYGVLVGEHGD